MITRRYFCLSALALAGRAQSGGGSPRTDFSTWQAVGAGSWTADGSEIIGRCVKGRAGKGYLFTRQEFTDFRLTLSFWISSGGSSALYFREPRRLWGPNTDPPGQGPDCGYKVRIDYHDAEYPTGSLCDVQKVRKVVGAEEQWNDLEIVCRKWEVRTSIAGQNVNRFNQLRVQPGVIGFELPDAAREGFAVHFKDVVIAPA